MRCARRSEARSFLERSEYRNSAGRVANRDRLEAEVAELTRRFKVDEIVELLNEAGLPCGPVYNVGQTFADPQVEHSGIAVPLEHPELGDVRLVGQPVRLRRTPFELRSRAPGLGEHTDEILAEAGLSAGEIGELRAGGVVA